MKLKKLIKKAFTNACEKGFHDEEKEVGTCLMLIVSELGEALEADRNNNHGYGKKDTFEDEIADVFIRLFDFCGLKKIDIERQIKWKMSFNKKREKLHGKKY